MPKFGTQADLARLMGVKESTITTWKNKGKLEGLVAPDGRIDLTKAKKLLPGRMNLKQQAKINKRWDKLPPEVAHSVADAVGDLSGLPFGELQRLNELEKLLLQQLRRKEVEGQFYPVKEIDDEFIQIGVAIREGLEGISSRIQALVAAERDAWECGQIIDKEVYQTLTRLADGLQTEPTNQTK